MTGSTLVQLNLVCSIYAFSMLNLGRILIPDLVVANLLMHSLPGMIPLYLSMPLVHLRCVCMRSLTIL